MLQFHVFAVQQPVVGVLQQAEASAGAIGLQRRFEEPGQLHRQPGAVEQELAAVGMNADTSRQVAHAGRRAERFCAQTKHIAFETEIGGADDGPLPLRAQVGELTAGTDFPQQPKARAQPFAVVAVARAKRAGKGRHIAEIQPLKFDLAAVGGERHRQTAGLPGVTGQPEPQLADLQCPAGIACAPTHHAAGLAHRHRRRQGADRRQPQVGGAHVATHLLHQAIAPARIEIERKLAGQPPRQAFAENGW